MSFKCVRLQNCQLLVFSDRKDRFLIISYHIRCKSKSNTCVVTFSWLRFWSLIVMVAWLCLVWIWGVASFSFHLCHRFLHFACVDLLFLFDWTFEFQLKRVVSPEYESESSDFGSACYIFIFFFFQIELKTVVMPHSWRNKLLNEKNEIVIIKYLCSVWRGQERGSAQEPVEEVDEKNV